MRGLQEWIYQLEEGNWVRPVKVILGMLALVALAVTFDTRQYRNFASEEAMNTAQIARNLATGRGYTTQVLHPFDLYLLAANGSHGLTTDLPEINHAPGYPAVLAGLMRVLPFQYKIADVNKLRFTRYEPEVIIAVFNQLLFLGSILLLFFLARRLFDPSVAWMSAIIFGGSELFWKFTISGLPTHLVILIFLGLVWVLTGVEARTRDEVPPARGWFLGRCLLIGVLLGMGALTQYSFGWLGVPILVYLILFGGLHRVPMCLCFLAGFVILLGPWVARNYVVSGTPFGSAGYSICELTMYFPEDFLERMITPEAALRKTGALDVGRKLLVHFRDIIEGDFWTFSGNWLSAFFLVGLLVPFRDVALSRLRFFVLGCLGVLLIVQPLARTHLTADSPVMTSENLLVWISPLVIVFGLGLFYVLLDQTRAGFFEFRSLVTGFFVLATTAPLWLNLLPPRTVTHAIVYPPYWPPIIKECSGWMKTNELMMSDIPAAVAWYGDRPCSCLTLNAQTEFMKLNEIKSVKAIYLTPRTLDKPFLTRLIKDPGWGSFVWNAFYTRQLPPNFPLRQVPEGFLPEQWFLSDSPRWEVKKSAP